MLSLSFSMCCCDFYLYPFAMCSVKSWPLDGATTSVRASPSFSVFNETSQLSAVSDLTHSEGGSSTVTGLQKRRASPPLLQMKWWHVCSEDLEGGHISLLRHGSATVCSAQAKMEMCVIGLIHGATPVVSFTPCMTVRKPRTWLGAQALLWVPLQSSPLEEVCLGRGGEMLRPLWWLISARGVEVWWLPGTGACLPRRRILTIALIRW